MFLTFKFGLLLKTIESEKFRIVIYCCFLHMVASGKLYCLSDNSGLKTEMIWIQLAHIYRAWDEFSGFASP